MIMVRHVLAALVLLMLALGLEPGPAGAGAPKVLEATLVKTRKNWDLYVKFSHSGPGERFGVDYWSVLTDRGERLRVVSPSRPRATDEPYESWMRDIPVPPGTRTLTVKLHDRIHGYEGVQPLVIDLAQPSGESYSIVDEEIPLPYRRYQGSHVRDEMLELGGHVPWVW